MSLERRCVIAFAALSMAFMALIIVLGFISFGEWIGQVFA